MRHLHLQPPFPRPHHTCQLRLRININADPDADINMEWIARGNAQALRDAERIVFVFSLHHALHEAQGYSLPDDFATGKADLNCVRPTDLVSVSPLPLKMDGWIEFENAAVEGLIFGNAVFLPRLGKRHRSATGGLVDGEALNKLGEWDPTRFSTGPGHPQKVFVFFGFADPKREVRSDIIYVTPNISPSVTLQNIREYIA